MWHASRQLAGSPARDGVLSLLLWVWLASLLYPLLKAGSIANSLPFLYLTGVLFAIEWLIPFWGVRLLAALFASAEVLHFYFFRAQPFWAKPWLQQIASLLWRHQWHHPVILTIGLLLVIMIAVWFYRFAVSVRSLLLLALGIGVVLIGAEDTFGPFRASVYMMLYVALGLLMLALCQIPQLEKFSRLGHRRIGWPATVLLSSLAVILISTGIGAAAPKLSPQWPDPVPYIKGYAAHQQAVNGENVKKVGYTSDDTHLGGSFVKDDGVALVAVSNQKGYWRGETRNIYTGKGWVQSSKSELNQINGNPNYVSRYLTTSRTIFGVGNPQIKTKNVTESITVMSGNPTVLFSQYQFDHLSNGAGDQSIYMNLKGLYARVDPMQPGTTYTVVSKVPYYDGNKFNSLFVSQDSANGMSESQLYQEDLAIPQEFPQRDRDLAKEIVAGASTDYEKAKAIEQYLRTHYSYETQNIPVPGPTDDFVDQFLFDSKKGYCDHFSSAMVMLARSVGLPARWVTGYAPGTDDTSYHDPNNPDLSRYIIRNSDAHAWAEVYLRGVGWIPFEATASFSMPAPVDQQDAPAVSPAVPLPDQAQITPAPKPQLDAPQMAAGNAAVKSSWAPLWYTLAICIGSLLTIGFVFRRKLLLVYLRTRALPGTDPPVTLKLILRFLWITRRVGFKGSKHQTLRERTPQMETYFGKEWIAFTRRYEQVRYGQQAPDDKRVGLAGHWFDRMLRKFSRHQKR